MPAMRHALAALALLLATPARPAATPAATPAASPAATHATPAAAPAAAHGSPAAAEPAGPAVGALILFPALGRQGQTTVTGRILGAAPRGLPGLTVEVQLGAQLRRVVSGVDGFFEATFTALGGQPFAGGPRAVQARTGAATAEGALQVVEDGAPFLLVVDADDFAGLTSRRAEPGDEEATPAALATLLRCVVEGTKPAVAVVALVEGGERADRLQAALAEGGFPYVGVLARPPSPRGAPPEAALRALLSAFPHRVMLLGDAGGPAPERFAAVRAEFPGQVTAVYVRSSPPGAANRRFDEMTLFTDPLRAARLAAERGLADRACVERPVAVPAPPAAEPSAPTAPAPCPVCPVCPAAR
jgi:phosphatidate phosphatase APP1